MRVLEEESLKARQEVAAAVARADTAEQKATTTKNHATVMEQMLKSTDGRLAASEKVIEATERRASERIRLAEKRVAALEKRADDRVRAAEERAHSCEQRATSLLTNFLRQPACGVSPRQRSPRSSLCGPGALAETCSMTTSSVSSPSSRVLVSSRSLRPSSSPTRQLHLGVALDAGGSSPRLPGRHVRVP